MGYATCLVIGGTRSIPKTNASKSCREYAEGVWNDLSGFQVSPNFQRQEEDLHCRREKVSWSQHREVKSLTTSRRIACVAKQKKKGRYIPYKNDDPAPLLYVYG